MLDFRAVKNLYLKIAFGVHFLLIFICCMENNELFLYKYMLYNIFFLTFLAWSIYNPKSDDILHMTFFINGISIVLDILALYLSPGRISKIIMAIAILNLLSRLLSTTWMGKIIMERLKQSTTDDGSDVKNESFEDVDSTHGARTFVLTPSTP